MKSDLTSKLPLREHIRNIKKMLKMIHEMDNRGLPFVTIVHILNIVIYYVMLLLSARVLDDLYNQVNAKHIVIMIIVTLTLCLGIKVITSHLYQKVCVIREKSAKRYIMKVEEKVMNMDFSRVESPLVKEMRDRIQNDNNWGAGLYSIYWAYDGIMYNILHMVGAVFVGFPILIRIFGTKNPAIITIIIFLIAVLIFSNIKITNNTKILTQIQQGRYSDEELKQKATFGWSFALYDGFSYKNGKDVRIYDGYNLFHEYTLGRTMRYETNKMSSCMGKGAGLAGISNAIITGGVYLVITITVLIGKLTVGDVIKYVDSLMKMFNLSSYIFQNVTELALYSRKQVSTFEFLEIEDEMHKGKLPVEKRSDDQYEIEFKNVSFSYPASTEFALKKISLKLKIGEKLAIVGMNGSGKTTMIKLLCRLYDPQEGEILLNGVNIKKFNQEEYAKLFSAVFQDYSLFSLAVGQNVAASTEYDEQLVKTCLEDSGFGDRLNNMEKGIETYLYKDYENDGVDISQGEAQKIAIARALYKDSPFILLDEPTAALDPLMEYEIYSKFDVIVGTKTAIYISHRLSSCRFCNDIVVLHEGRLVQRGDHEQLVKDIGGKYYEMWSAQAQYYV